MTMKTKKTLQHIAAVAVVLLALCLVFAAPVSAEPVAKIGSIEYATLQEAVDAALATAGAEMVTINVCEGTISDVVANTSAKHNITIQGVKGQTIITGGIHLGTNTEEDYKIIVKDISFKGGHGLYINGYKDVTVEGCTFNDVVANSPNSFNTYNIGSITVWHSDEVLIQNNFIDNSTDDGIHVNYFKNVTIFNSEINATTSNSITITEGEAGGIVNVTENRLKNWGLADNDNEDGNDGRALRVAFASSSPQSLVLFYGNIMEHNTVAPEEFVKITNLGKFTEEGLEDYYPAFVFSNYWNDADPYVDPSSEAKKYIIIGTGSTNAEAASKEQIISFVSSMDDISSADVKIPVDSAYLYFYFLDDAIADAVDGDTIPLANDVTGEIIIDKSIIIDGNGKTINGMVNLSSTKDSIDVTLKNINVDGGTSYAVKVGTKANLIIDGANLAGYSAVYVSHKGQTNGEADGDGSTVTIQNSKLSSTNNAGEHETNSFGTVAIFANDTKIEISGSTLAATAIKNNQSIIRFGGSSENANIKHTGSSVSIVNSVLDVQTAGKTSIYSVGTKEQGTLTLALGEGVTSNVNPSAYIAGGMEVVQPGDKYLVQKYVDRSSSSSSSSTTEPEEPEQPEEPVVEPETPAAPGEVAASTEVTDGGEVAFETTVVDEETGEQSAPAEADDEIKGVVLPTGTEGTVEFVPVSETPAPAGQEENTKRVFEINVPSYKKGEASVIKFQMTVAEIEADGKTAADVALWHYDEETGEWTKLVTSFIIKDGIVYFEAITNDFSPFAIIYEDEPAGDLPTDTPETPEQPEEPASPAPVLAVLAALGAAVVLRRK